MPNRNLQPEYLVDKERFPYGDQEIILNESIEVAMKIIISTQKIFTKGSSSRQKDYLVNRAVAINVVESRALQDALKSTHGFGRIFSAVIASHKFNAGNCAEMAYVSMYQATFFPKELDCVQYITIENYDHALMKLIFKNKDVLYVDPWFLNDVNYGVIFDEANRENYFNKIKTAVRAWMFVPKKRHISIFIWTFMVVVFLGLKYEMEDWREALLYVLLLGGCANTLLFLCPIVKIEHDFISRDSLINDPTSDKANSFHLFQASCKAELEKNTATLLFSDALARPKDQSAATLSNIQQTSQILSKNARVNSPRLS